MKNTLTDLNNHLFAQLERLSDENLTGEKLEMEMQRADIITKVAGVTIKNAELVLEAEKFKIYAYSETGDKQKLPGLLEG